MAVEKTRSGWLLYLSHFPEKFLEEYQYLSLRNLTEKPGKVLCLTYGAAYLMELRPLGGQALYVLNPTQGHLD